MRDAVRAFQRELILSRLERHNWNVRAARESLRLPKTTFHRYAVELGLRNRESPPGLDRSCARDPKGDRAPVSSIPFRAEAGLHFPNHRSALEKAAPQRSSRHHPPAQFVLGTFVRECVQQGKQWRRRLSPDGRKSRLGGGTSIPARSSCFFKCRHGDLGGWTHLPTRTSRPEGFRPSRSRANSSALTRPLSPSWDAPRPCQCEATIPSDSRSV